MDPIDGHLDKLLGGFAPEARAIIRPIWERLPKELQNQLIDAFAYLPTDSASGMKQLLRIAREQAQMAFGNKRNVTILGPANVGKTTLYNQLVISSTDSGAVSPIPGTTKNSQMADAGLFMIVDTPGADAPGRAGYIERERAWQSAKRADFLVVMFDLQHGIKQGDVDLYRSIVLLGKPLLVVLNKLDAVRRWHRGGAIEKAAESLGLSTSEVVAISARDGLRLEKLLTAIVKSEPALVAALGQAMPKFRAKLAWQAIFRSATAAGVVALTPIPIIDFIPLATVQAMLVLTIARIYRYKLTVGRARELMGSLGMGYLGRVLFYELSKLGGPPTWLISVAVAAATTIMVGFAALRWFESGEKLSRERMRTMTRELTRQLIERLNPLARRTPDRQSIADEMASILQDTINRPGNAFDHFHEAEIVPDSLD